VPLLISTTTTKKGNYFLFDVISFGLVKHLVHFFFLFYLSFDSFSFLDFMHSLDIISVINTRYFIGFFFAPDLVYYIMNFSCWKEEEKKCLKSRFIIFLFFRGKNISTQKTSFTCVKKFELDGRQIFSVFVI
jgi:hypothetical protein